MPDRANKHQSRVEQLPLWLRLTEKFQQLAGEPRTPLLPLNRSLASLDRLWSLIRGGITSAAAKMGRYCGSIHDAIEILRILDEGYGESDQDWDRRWEEKARKFGTLDDATSFRPFDEGMAA